MSFWTWAPLVAKTVGAAVAVAVGGPTVALFGGLFLAGRQIGIAVGDRLAGLPEEFPVDRHVQTRATRGYPGPFLFTKSEKQVVDLHTDLVGDRRLWAEAGLSDEEIALRTGARKAFSKEVMGPGVFAEAEAASAGLHPLEYCLERAQQRAAALSPEEHRRVFGR